MSNLGPQFSQPELPGMPPRMPPPLDNEPACPEGQDCSEHGAYGISARDMPGERVENPILAPVGDPRRNRFVNAISNGIRGERDFEWVPSTEVRSTQTEINRGAVDHIVEHAGMGDLPDTEMFSVPHGDATDYWVRDGNHRTNAALRRGNLFVPARVTRLKP